MLLQAEKKLWGDLQPSDLELAILRTVAYFAYSRYPVTAFEIWKWLLEPEREYSFGQVFGALQSSSYLQAKIFTEQGFYSLEKDPELLKNRRTRLANALHKYAKLKRLAVILGRVPYIEGVAICNSLAFHHTVSESDIDLFVIARKGRVWSARFFSTLPLILLRERPGERAEDPVCLSFFATRDSLGFERLKIGERDPYLAFWSKSLIPLSDKTGWLKRFEAENGWIKKVLPNAYAVKRSLAFRLKSRWAIPFTPMGEVLAERVQEERFPRAIRLLRNRDTRVIITKDMLKFHAEDRRAEIRDALDACMKTAV
jgi:hypothetical protein